jgi:hypothetical protein
MQEWVDAVIKLGVLPAIISFLLYERSKEKEADRIDQKVRNDLEAKRLVVEAEQLEEMRKIGQTLVIVNDHLTQCKK